MRIRFRRALVTLGNPVFVLFGVSLLAAASVDAAGMNSTYSSLEHDVTVNGASKVLLSASIQGNQPVLIVSDGSYSPESVGNANVYIVVDGKKVSNDSLIDWRNSRAPVAHSFRAIAAPKLGEGSHRVELVATGHAGFTVAAGTNLSVMTDPASFIGAATMGQDSPVVALPTGGLVNGRDPLPLLAVSSINVGNSDGPVVSLASGHSYFAGDPDQRAHMYGDAMWLLSFDGNAEDGNNSTYADNDICLCAETQAPMYVQGFVGKAEKVNTVSLNASVEPWGKGGDPEARVDGVHYRVGAGTTLVVLGGGMTVAGHATMVNTEKQEPVRFNRTPYVCIASDQAWPRCPQAGIDVSVLSQTVRIPSGHNGVLFVSAITRVQGDKSDQGGIFRLWFTIDGKKRGSEGTQHLAPRSGNSTRTVSASYLSTGSESLSPGDHVISLHASGDGHFIHLAVTRNMPVMWFD